MEPKTLQIPRFTKRTLVITAGIALLATIIGFNMTGNREWLMATPYGGVIGIINLWILALFVTRLLTEKGGFDYKTLGLLIWKFLILFGGLGAGIFLFHLEPVLLMVGFFSFLGGLLFESFLWAISATTKSDE